MKSWLRAFTLGLAGLASFAIFTLAVRALVPLDPSYGLRAKFEAFADERDEFDAVYLGSSLSFRAYQPVVIDKVVSRSGPPFRSFNLAMADDKELKLDFSVPGQVAGHRELPISCAIGRSGGVPLIRALLRDRDRVAKQCACQRIDSAANAEQTGAHKLPVVCGAMGSSQGCTT